MTLQALPSWGGSTPFEIHTSDFHSELVSPTGIEPVCRPMDSYLLILNVLETLKLIKSDGVIITWILTRLFGKRFDSCKTR